MQNDAQAAFVESARALKARIATPHVDPLPLPQLPGGAAADRRRRSLNTCHRYAQTRRPRKAPPRASRAYVPELAARLEDDPNLTDGARRCARKLAELIYRQNREGRSLPVTVTYLAKALGRCCRTVQRYLRQLEREGYVSVDVIVSQRARMCVGLVVRVLDRCWPRIIGKNGRERLESQGRHGSHRTRDSGYPQPARARQSRSSNGRCAAWTGFSASLWKPSRWPGCQKRS
jgi:hypothetical protein